MPNFIQLYHLHVLRCISLYCTEVSSKDKNNTTSSGRGGGGGKKSSGSSGVGGAVMSTDGHENMRSGLASVMSTLDDMLEGMKKK